MIFSGCFFRKTLFLAIIFVFMSFFIACKDSKSSANSFFKGETIPFKYAKNIKLTKFLDAYYLEIEGKSWLLIQNSTDTTLLKKSLESPEHWKHLSKIHIPAKRPVILSNSYLAYMRYLGLSKSIVGVGEKKYFADTSFYNYLVENQIPDLGNGPTILLEKLLTLSSDLILTFSTGNAKYDDYTRMKSLGLPVLWMAEWNEVSPLAKAEWVRLFGVLFGKEKTADSLFLEIEKNYQEKMALVPLSNTKPKVLIGAPIAGVWMAPSGESYTASLVRDAGGDYIWKNTKKQNWLQIPLEEAFVEAIDATVWLHPSNFSSPEEVLASESRVEILQSWQSKQVYQFDKEKSPLGALDFYEEAVIRPDLVLEDLLKVLYPELFQKNDTKWYRNIYIF